MPSSRPTVPSPRSSPRSISSTTSFSAASFSSSTASRSNKRYLTAATFLYDQLAQQPRNAEGGYWHKQRYPNQMWLDGLYMAEPFRAEYASISHHPEEFADITHQFVLMEQHARDPKPACSITAGMHRSRSAGPTSKPATHPNSGRAAWAGT
jgi:rhamnogalacturonyl hydrolase YesR